MLHSSKTAARVCGKQNGKKKARKKKKKNQVNAALRSYAAFYTSVTSCGHSRWAETQVIIMRVRARCQFSCLLTEDSGEANLLSP